MDQRQEAHLFVHRGSAAAAHQEADGSVIAIFGQLTGELRQALDLHGFRKAEPTEGEEFLEAARNYFVTYPYDREQLPAPKASPVMPVIAPSATSDGELTPHPPRKGASPLAVKESSTPKKK